PGVMCFEFLLLGRWASQQIVTRYLRVLYSVPEGSSTAGITLPETPLPIRCAIVSPRDVGIQVCSVRVIDRRVAIERVVSISNGNEARVCFVPKVAIRIVVVNCVPVFRISGIGKLRQ